MSQEKQEETPDVWIKHMHCGAFEEAWKYSDLVLSSRTGQPCWHLPRHFQNIWDGNPLHGKRVFVRCYHGLGDTIQFIRYAPLLKEIATEVIVWAQPPLIPLLKTVPEIDKILPLHDGTPEAEFDADVEVMELPHIFRTTVATIPDRHPYLHAEPKQLSKTKDQLSVGLVWKAGVWDERRSIPFKELLPLSEISGVKIHILQANATDAGWQEDFGHYPGEFELHEYAQIIKGLDLLITVDSMPAHLAGALGVPVWTLLHAEADWRWMDKRCDSPWYPSMKLFRQPEAGNWQAVLGEVTSELKKIVKEQKGLKQF